jgi:hypothetical protein
MGALLCNSSPPRVTADIDATRVGACTLGVAVVKSSDVSGASDSKAAETEQESKSGDKEPKESKEGEDAAKVGYRLPAFSTR